MKLDDKIEELLDLIIDGKTFRAIANQYNVSISTLHDYLHKEENAVRTTAALALSAAQYADKAEDVLIAAERDPVEMTRARELAQHYRWKASKRNPKAYGDKIDLTSDGNALAQQVIILPAKDKDTEA